MLLDHFHPPLKPLRQWNSFHHAWCTNMAASLNHIMPEGYFAENNIHFGIEVDVAGLAIAHSVKESRSAYALPPPTQTLPVTIISDVVEVLVYRSLGGPTLVAAIELVSPANKDRPASRDAFVSKCASLVQQGIGLVVIDIVTERKANLHNELLFRLAPPEWIPIESALYTSAYHLIDRDGNPALETWQESLALGKPMPTMPLFIGDGEFVPVDLNATYAKTCIGLKIPGAIVNEMEISGAR
jgi:hypothetical protein